MGLSLNDHEIRVLGVLIEKSLAHPDSYPLTLNAIVLGANQKQNRQPVLELSESDVATAVHSLVTRQLAKHAPPTHGARANRFQHHVVERLHWDRREQAVMAELMLRGRQTAGELRSRADRMTSIQDLESVNSILQGLATGDPPFVEELPREPGRSANRFRHLLGGSDVSSVPAAPVASEAAAAQPTLVARVEQLEASVARLLEAVESLRKNQAEAVDRASGPPV